MNFNEELQEEIKGVIVKCIDALGSELAEATLKNTRVIDLSNKELQPLAEEAVDGTAGSQNSGINNGFVMEDMVETADNNGNINVIIQKNEGNSNITIINNFVTNSDKAKEKFCYNI